MTKQQFINWAKARGWEQDKFGHLRKGEHRFKLSSTAARYEKQITFSDGKHEWIRIMSGYFSKLSISPNNQLTGMTR